MVGTVVTGAVIEIGPESVRARGGCRTELARVAIEYIDDELALVDERVVLVDDLWVDLLRSVTGEDDDCVALVFPTWWPAARVDRVTAAARRVVPDVAVMTRGSLLAGKASAVVEISADIVMVTGPGADVVVPVLDDDAAVATRVRAAVGLAPSVLIDGDAGALRHVIADCLERAGVAVTRVAADEVRRAAAASLPPEVSVAGCAPTGRRVHKAPALLGVTAAVVACAGFVARAGEDTAATRWLVEGRVGVTVPASWPARRITSGPGSARLQLVSPSDGEVSLNLTQSVGAQPADLATTATALRAAAVAESTDVFADFAVSEVRGGRPAVTYREMRRDRHVAWTVLVDRDVRIAIGCQSSPAREHLIRDACEQAVQSARAVP